MYTGKRHTRREVLRRGALGAGAAVLAPTLGASWFAPSAHAARPERILVVLELSGGNDGLNSVVPYGDDAYYRQRPTLGIPAAKLRKIDDHFGFNPGLAGFERLYKDGAMAIVHGCGYEQPSFSHFTSMAYWHTAAPNSGEEYGWLGRLADLEAPEGGKNHIVNIDNAQSLAVRSRAHTPLVFDAPDRFSRKGYFNEQPLLNRVPAPGGTTNPTAAFLRDLARSARDSAETVRAAWDAYDTPVDYGIAPTDLPKIAALIDAGMPSRFYYTSFRNNQFDTHVHQANLHERLLTYASDAVAGFMRDLKRIGRADDVALLIFSEFGRRVPENTSLGTDHGAANAMFVVGSALRGGHYGTLPSLTELDEGDNLLFTTDFRRVYATMVSGWLQSTHSEALLGGAFEPFPIFT